MPFEFGDAMVMLVFGGGGAVAYFLIIRKISAWLLSLNLLPLVLLLWLAAAGLALYVVIGWLKREGA